MNYYPETPKIPTYTKNPADLVFDTSLEIDLNTDHIVSESMDRLPQLITK